MPYMKLIVPLDDRAVIAISGEDAREFLQGLITNDIEKVSPTQAIYAALLTPQGKFLHDFFITEYKERLLIDCESERISDLIKRLTMYRLRAKVDITDESEQWEVGVMLPMSDVGGLGSGAAARPVGSASQLWGFGPPVEGDDRKDPHFSNSWSIW